MESTPSVPCPQALRVQEPAVVGIDPDGDLLLKVGSMRCITPDDPEEEEEEDEEEEEEEEEEQADEEGAKEEKEPQVAEEPEHNHAPPVTFRVCSRTMARSSPVWKKMLYGGYAESKPKDRDWIVEIPDDDVLAVEFFLNTIHTRFEKVPPFNETPELDHLYRIAVVADKYDMIRFLRPWAGT
ncbi:hypothetical protein PG985_014295 [Apiospora marii]|uniref:BTB domain-containing protein n=1 Tax=Apiospora marii TaxID=335849 RepID=A0ABR1R5C7_9PEZI